MREELGLSTARCDAMDCRICEQTHRQFFCENCLRTHVRDFRHQTHHFATDRDEQIAKASRALEHINAVRIPRAEAAEYQRRVDELSDGLARLRRDNDKKRDRLRILRESLAARRRTLSPAKLRPSRPPAHPSDISKEAQELTSLSATIARARQGLVQELVEVFNVVEVGGRPPIGTKAGAKGEWTIGNLILPVPGDIRRYPPDHINAVITHTIHFLSLLTFYLGIRLPFEITWSGKRLGIGQPWIGAIKGSENGGWAKYHKKHPLHLSSSGPSGSTPNSSSNTVHSAAGGWTSAEGPSEIPSNIPITESYVDSMPPEQPHYSPFMTALAMLLYDVSYLAWTQNVDVPLSQAGDVLSNLWSVCCSSELGRKSHEGTPFLPPPTPAAFPLDFAQLLQATSVNPASRVRSSRVSGSSLSRFPVSSSSSSSARNVGAHAISGKMSSAGRTPIRERIVEEAEEDWDLIDEDVGLD